MSKLSEIFYFVYVVTVVAAVVVSAQVSDSPAESGTHAPKEQPIDDSGKNKSENTLDLKSLDKKFFTKLFIRKRKEQIEHVLRLKSMSKYEHQYKIIQSLTEKMIEMAESKKNFLDSLSEMDIRNISFAPTGEKDDTKEAISSVLENTALFGDIVLNLPDMTHRLLKTKPAWNSTIKWSFDFLNRTKFLVDNATLEMVDLAVQELSIVERKPDYFNVNHIQFTAASEKSKKSRKKEKKKRGPVMTRYEL